MIKGLSHITLIVSDLDKTEQMLSSILGARKIYDSGDRTFSLSQERFLLVGESEPCLWLVIMRGNPHPEPTYDHIAFQIDDADYDEYARKIRKAGLDASEGRPRIGGEARSLYFHDHDNHMFELHTGTLSERLSSYKARP